jgi:DNA-binding NtrC family response regulator
MDAPAAEGSSPDRQTILIVDDEVALGKMLCLIFRREGFQVHYAIDGSQAIDLYRRHRVAIDLVLMDVRMPGQDGVQTLAALQELDPDVRCCFMSGETGRHTIPELLAKGAIDVLLKPFCDLQELKRQVWKMVIAVSEPGA